GLVAGRLASDRGLRRPRSMRHSYIDRPRRIRAPRATPRSRARFLPAVVALPAVAVLWLTIGLPMLSQLTSAGGSNRLGRSVVFGAQGSDPGVGPASGASAPETVATAIVSNEALAADPGSGAGPVGAIARATAMARTAMARATSASPTRAAQGTRAKPETRAAPATQATRAKAFRLRLLRPRRLRLLHLRLRLPRLR